MLTPTHGALSLLIPRFFGKFLEKWDTLLVFVGAVLPDIPSLVVFTEEAISYCRRNGGVPETASVHGTMHLLARSEESHFAMTLLGEASKHEWATDAHRWLHSLPMWLIIAALSLLAWRFAPVRGKEFGRKALVLAIGAIVFHILADWMTHQGSASPYFWPVSRRRWPGLFAHDDPILLTFELTVWALWMTQAFFALVKRVRRNRRKEVA